MSRPSVVAVSSEASPDRVLALHVFADVTPGVYPEHVRARTLSGLEVAEIGTPEILRMVSRGCVYELFPRSWRRCALSLLAEGDA